MSGVPYTFGTATTSIPLSNLDSNFVTPVTIGNASVALGNTITTIGNLTLTNPTIIGGTSNISSTSITNGTSNVTILSSGGAVNIATNGTTAMTIDTSQNVGIGTTPSAWGSGYKVIQNTAGFFGNYQTSTMIVGQNFYDSAAGSFKYVANGLVSKYEQAGGGHAWYNAPTGTAGNAVSFTQAMTLDSSGNLLVGTTTATSTLSSGQLKVPQGVAGGLALTVSALSTRYAFNGGGVNGILILRDNSVGGSAVWLLDPNNGALVISTNIAATYTITFSGGAWGITQLTGATPKLWSYFMIAGE